MNPVKISMNFYVLAGGQSSRIGKNKALLQINQETLIQKVISSIPAKKERIKIVTNTPETYHFLSIAIIQDIYPNLGPISGVHAGLVDSCHHYNFFLPCDLPFITEDVIQFVLQKHDGQDIFGLRTEKGIEPLCAIYSKKCLPVLEKQIEKRVYSLHRVFELLPSEFIKIENQIALYNLNTLQDWNRVLNLLN